MGALVLVENVGAVRVVTLNRPAVRNAVDRAMAADLARAFREFEDDHLSKVAVLTGSAPDFCAGADLGALADDRPNDAGGRGPRLAEDGDGPLGVTRMRLDKPVVAAIEGHAVAGGLELALWCDLRVAAANATFGVYCRRWGVPLVDGGTIRLPRLVGQSHALDLILTGRAVRGDEAAAMGLVNRLVRPGGALAAAIELAAEVAGFPEGCMRADRRSALAQWDLPLDEALRQEARGGLEVLATGETADGARRFKGRRA
ncbi:MAG: crotonase/enoyl-CoA hydratase family protein [Candidatus Dormibacteria bacterium]